MRRPAAIHYKATDPLTRKGHLSVIKQRWHLHFCVNRDCRQTYDDFKCKDVGANGRCHTCRGLERPEWETSRDPQPCCYGNTYVVTDKTELIRQQLAGPGPWFKCQTCARSHGWPCNDPNERKP